MVFLGFGNEDDKNKELNIGGVESLGLETEAGTGNIDENAPESVQESDLLGDTIKDDDILDENKDYFTQRKNKKKADLVAKDNGGFVGVKAGNDKKMSDVDYIMGGNLFDSSIKDKLVAPFRAINYGWNKFKDILFDDNKLIREYNADVLSTDSKLEDDYNTIEQMNINSSSMADTYNKISTIKEDKDLADLDIYTQETNKISDNYVKLQNEYDKKVEEGDEVGATKIKEEMDSLQKDYILKQAEFVLGQSIYDSNTMLESQKNFFDNIRKAIPELEGVSDTDIFSYLGKSAQKKYMGLLPKIEQLDALKKEFNRERIENLSEIQLNTISDVFDKRGYLLSDGYKNELNTALYGDVGEYLAWSKGDPKKTVGYYEGMSIYNDLIKDVVQQSGLKYVYEGDLGDNGEVISNNLLGTVKSEQFQALKNKMLTMATNGNFVDEKGNFDYVTYANALKTTNERQKFSETLGDNVLRLKMGRKSAIADEGTVLDKVTSFINKNIYKANKALYNKETEKSFTNSVVDNISLAVNPTSILTYGIKKGTKGMYDKYLGDFYRGVKRKDQLYAQNQINRIKDSLQSFGEEAISNPVGLYADLATAAIPVMGPLGKIYEGSKAAEGIAMISKPFWRAAARMGAKGAIELAEGLPLNLMFDSAFNIEKTDPVFYGLDFGIGALGGIAKHRQAQLLDYIVNGDKKLGVNIGLKKLSDNLVKDGIEIGSKEYEEAIRAGLTRMGLPNDIDFKNIKNTIDLFSEVENTFRKGIAGGEEFIRHKVQKQILLDTLDSGKGKADEVIDMLYDAMKNEDPKLVENLTKKYAQSNTTKLDVLADIRESTKNTIGAYRKALGQKGFIALGEHAGAYEAIDNTVDSLLKGIETIKDPALKKELKTGIMEFNAKARARPLYQFSPDWADKEMGFKDTINNIIRKIEEYGDASTVKDIKLNFSIPKDIEKSLKGKTLPEIAAELTKNESVMKSVGSKKYNMEEFVSSNRYILEKSLGKRKTDALYNLLKNVNNAYGGNVKIAQLPEAMKKVFRGVNSVISVLGGNKEQEVIISTLGILSADMKKGDVLKQVDSIGKQLGHLIFGALKKDIKNKAISEMVSFLDSVGSVEKFVGDLLPGLKEENPELLNKIISIKNKKQMSEEILSYSISENLRAITGGKPGVVDKMGNDMLSSFLKGKPVDVKKGLGSFNKETAIIVNKYLQGLEGVYAYTNGGTLENLSATLRYATANLYYEGKAGLSSVAGARSYVATKTFGEEAYIFKSGITSFDVAKIYSNKSLVDVLKNPNNSVEDISKLIHQQLFDNVESNIDIIKKIEALDMPKSEIDKIKSKYNTAVSIAQQRHNISILNVNKLYDIKKGELLLGQKLANAIRNVGSKITKKGYVNFAGLNIVKYWNIGDKKGYGELVKHIGSKMFHDLQPKIVENISEVFGSVLGKSADEIKAMIGSADSFSKGYLEFIDSIEKKLIDSGINGGLEIKEATEMAKDLMSRMVVDGQGYLYAIGRESKKLLSGAPEDVIASIGKVLVERNKQTATQAIKVDLDKILAGMSSSDTSILKKDLLGKVTGSKLISIRYENSMFNLLAAKSEAYILDFISNGTVDKIPMSNEHFYSFLTKIDNSRQTILTKFLNTTLSDSGVDIFGLLKGDTSMLNRGDNISDIVDNYIQFMVKNDKEILAGISKQKYNKILKTFEDIKNKGFSTMQSEYIMSHYTDLNKGFASKVSLDGYMFDTLKGDDIRKAYKDSLELVIGDVVYTDEFFDLGDVVAKDVYSDARSSYVEGIKKLNSDGNVEGVKNVINTLSKFDIYADGNNVGKFNKFLKDLVNEDIFKDLFNIKGDRYAIELNEKVLGYGSDFSLKYVEGLSKSYDTVKKNIFSKIVGGLVNPATIAENNKGIRDIIYDGIEAHSKFIKVNEGGALAKYMEKLGKKDGYVNIGSFMHSWVKDMQKIVKENKLGVGTKLSGGEYIDGIFGDLRRGYEKAFFTSKKATRKLAELSEYSYNSDDYILMIDSFVEAFGKARRSSKKGLFTVQEFNTVLDSIKTSFNESRTFAFGAIETSDILEGLKGHWIGMSAKDISKLKNEAGLFNGRIFDNFLFKSFSRSDIKNSSNFWIQLKKIGLSGERKTASMMYFLFYNVFGSGWSAGLQQVGSNAIHMKGKLIADIAETNIDNMDDLIDVTSKLFPFDIIGGQGRAEFEGIGNMVTKMMGASSALAWSDKAIERGVMKYAFTSALLEQGYTAEGAIGMIKGLKEASMSYVEKGYDKILSFDKFMLMGNKEAEFFISNRLSKLVKEGSMELGESIKEVEKFMSFKNSVSGVSDVVKNARIKTQTFYQVADIPELVQNRLGGKAGAFSMRFMNWASRKAGDYAYKFADALVKNDTVGLTKIITQVASEGAVAYKYYNYMDRLSNGASYNGGGMDMFNFGQSVFLPFTLMNMLTLRSVDILRDVYMQTAGSDDLDNVASSMGEVWKNAFYNYSSQVGNRAGMSLIYFASQYNRINHGLDKLQDGYDESQVMVSGLGGIAGKIIEMFANITQNRISKYDTSTLGGINREYLNSNGLDALLNFSINAKASKNALDDQKFMDAYRRINGNRTEDGGLMWNILPYSEDNKFAVRATNKFYKEKGLATFLYGGTNISEKLNEIEALSDDKSLQKYFAANGKDYSDIKEKRNNGYVAEIANSLGLDAASYGEIKDNLKVSGTEKGNTVWNIVMSKLSPYKGDSEQKGLYEIGKPADLENKFNKIMGDIVNDINKQLETNPKLLKAGAFNLVKLGDKVEHDLNEFGESNRIALILNAMATANRAAVKDIMKQKYGKTEWKFAKNSPEVIKALSIADSEYKMNLIATNYNAITQANQTVGRDLAMMNTNLSKDSPYAKDVMDRGTLGTFLWFNMIDKTIRSQGLSSFGTNNILGNYTKKIFSSCSSMSDDDKNKEKCLKGSVGLLRGALSVAENIGDFKSIQNTKVGLAAATVDNINIIKKYDPELLRDMAKPFKDYLDRVTVSDPIEDEKIKADIDEEIFNKGGNGKGKKKIPTINMKMLADKLNKFSDFKTDFYRAVLKQEPLDHVKYNVKGHRIVPLKVPAEKARPKKVSLPFIKVINPTEIKSEDLVVAKTRKKTISSKYRPKTIKNSKVYKRVLKK